MKRIYATTDPFEAEMIGMALRDRGIAATVDQTAEAIGVVGPAASHGISVAEADVERASAVLREVLEARKRAAG
jgi:putative signal transducing protein